VYHVIEREVPLLVSVAANADNNLIEQLQSPQHNVFVAFGERIK